MKYLITLSLFFTTFNFIYAKEKTIYGSNDRLDVHLFEDRDWQIRAASTCSLIQPELIYHLDGINQGLSLVFGPTYKETQNLCDGVRFENQITSATCSGFLIAPDLVATAGHCIDKEEGCGDSQWIFGFHQQFEHQFESGQKAIVVATSNIYNCQQILRHKQDFWGNDYAVIQLDRMVENYAPLKIRTSGKIADNANLIIIGNPSGLPTKIAGNAKVRENWSNITFSANLDSFPGNSGSAVFNAETGIVEGIHVRGWRYAFTYKAANQCYIPTVRPNQNHEATVTRITKILAGTPPLELPQQ